MKSLLPFLGGSKPCTFSSNIQFSRLPLKSILVALKMDLWGLMPAAHARF